MEWRKPNRLEIRRDHRLDHPLLRRWAKHAGFVPRYLRHDPPETELQFPDDLPGKRRLMRPLWRGSTERRAIGIQRDRDDRDGEDIASRFQGCRIISIGSTARQIKLLA